MTALCLLDTSVLCEPIPVPGKSQAHQHVRAEFDRLRTDGHQVFLPFATLLETGNHIGRIDDAQLRQQAARRFVQVVRSALEGDEPFQLFRIPDRNDLARWLDAFPGWAQCKGAGLGDLSIEVEWRRLCCANRKRRVWVWSLDAHLAGLDSADR